MVNINDLTIKILSDINEMLRIFGEDEPDSVITELEKIKEEIETEIRVLNEEKLMKERTIL